MRKQGVLPKKHQSKGRETAFSGLLIISESTLCEHLVYWLCKRNKKIIFSGEVAGLSKTSPNCNKFYCNLTFYKLNTYLILTSACLVLWSKNVSTDKNFLRNILVTRGDPLSAHVRACAVVVVDRRMSRVLHCIFGPQKTNYAGR